MHLANFASIQQFRIQQNYKLMKRTLLLGLCAIAISATATQSIDIRTAPRNHTPIKAGMWEISALSHRLASRQASKKATTETPVSNAPAGQLFENMYVNSNSYGLGFGDVYSQVVDGGLGGVVEGNDGYVYVQAPISQAYVSGAWLAMAQMHQGRRRHDSDGHSANIRNRCRRPLLCTQDETHSRLIDV